MDMAELGILCRRLTESIGSVVVGQDDVVESLLVALFAGGHILIEGVPGTAKTLLAHSFALSLELELKRIQFTPDLMPGDVVGTNLFNFHTGAFSLTRGPIFTDILLADEVNRTPPKTQSALLQAMQERAVTIDGVAHRLSDAFLVIATQNPIEQEGTYPLPEAQLDRFLLKVLVGFPSLEEEREIVRRHGSRSASPDVASLGLPRIADRAVLAEARALCAGVRVGEEIVEYVVALCRATRASPAILHGVSPRATNMLATASRALAAVRGRAFVIPDDVKELFLPAARHRIVLAPAAELEGLDSDAALQQVLDAVPAPR
ncbi:MAG: MoxR family ATPase [Polyangiaceae bacterium]|nr:MoxR family ATPase [Polyangiaceae bacterium]